MQLGQVFPAQYQALLDSKVSEMQQLFRPFGIDQTEVYPSSPEHYRLRA